MKPVNEISIQYLKGVGPARKKLFHRLGIETIEDIFYFFPRRYEDRREMKKIADVTIGEPQTVVGRVVDSGGHRAWYTKKHVTTAVIDDGANHLTCVWFNQPYVAHYFRLGERAIVHGKVDTYKDRLQMVAPEYEIIGEDDEGISTGCIVPVYPLTQGLTQRSIRRIMYGALDKYASHIHDVLPFDLREKYGLDNLVSSLRHIHWPKDMEKQEQALKRISFEEFFLFQVSVTLRRMSITQKKGVAHNIDEKKKENYLERFPFKLTGAQRRVIDEIAADMQRSSPMHRLLQGDVGSGKTIVALFGCLVAACHESQSALMVPTEILAHQHFETVTRLIQGGILSGLKCACLTSSMKKDQRVRAIRQIENGQVDLVIGTHALIQQDVHFNRLSYVIVDEQHKFGVRQRSVLPGKGINPDVLIMTATPIPRTLCLTLYGDLDVSRLDEMPKNRGQVETLNFSQAEAHQAYEIVRQKVKEGKQAYVIYPLVEESEKIDLKAAREMVENFQNQIFKEYRIGLIHGQMKKGQADKAMDEFKKGTIQILVATTILEVGVDVPDANCMVIEHAERFGLSQLHQLRGRIGRSEKDATCILIADPSTEQAQARLRAVLSTTDGFKIAEEDLLIRGPGQFFGRHQHGLNELRVADPLRQIDLLEAARAEAINLLENDPHLKEIPHREIEAVIKKRYPAYLDLARAG